jgi:hypothetical protein
MLEKSRLEELSAELPEAERKELLERIAKRMAGEESEEAIPVDLREDEREKIIAFEMKKAGWWVRFVVWLRTFVSGRRKRDVFVEVRLRLLKAKIRNANSQITGFETRDLSPKFARRLYDLYLRLQPLLGVYRSLAGDKVLKGAAYSWYVEKRWEQAKKSVEEFVRGEEMEEIFAQSGQTEEIRKKLTFRLGEYIRAVPETLMLQLEEHARLHLYLGKLSAFPFASLFRYFSFLLPETPEAKFQSFEHAPVMLTLDLLEKLHVALSLVRRNAPDYLYAEEPVAYLFLLRGGHATAETPDLSKIEPDLTRLRVQIDALGKELESFDREVPLLDLLRYFRRDPWYQLVFNPPRLYLKSLYFATLKERIGVQLEERLGSIRERVIGSKILELLKGERPVEFTHFKEMPDFDVRKLGLPFFSHTRSLNFAYRYILHHCKGTLQEAAQIVATTALANNRIMQNRLTQNISGLEDLEARIVLYDRSFSTDEEDGKQLSKFRVTVANDLLQQKAYRAFVIQKDREARDLLEKARDYLVGVQRIFDEIRSSAFENTRSLLKTLHVYRGRNQTLGQILNVRSEAIGAFLKLLDQLLELERGP